MTLSVIVTTYNRPDALKKVLEGLYAQSPLPDEILVADDGSGKETEQMLAGFENRPGPRFCHIWQPDRGFRVARARNLAIAASSGEYLVFLDGDCIPAPHFLADHLALAEPGCFVQGKRVMVEENAAPGFNVADTRSLGRLIRYAATLRIGNAHHIFRIPFFPCFRKRRVLYGMCCNMGVFSKDARSVNGFNHIFEGWGSEDDEFAVRLSKMGLVRKRHSFLAICYHLGHRKNSRARDEHNYRLRQRAIASDSWVCKNGLNTIISDHRLYDSLNSAERQICDP